LNPVLLLVDSMADGVKTAVNSEEMMANDDDAERSVASVEDQLRKEMTVYEVDWGKISMVDAEKRLLANALEDPDNQHFVLLSDSKHGSCNVPNGSNTAVNIEGTKVKSIVGIVEKSQSGGDGSGNNNHKSAQREATLIKFRQKREVRCFQKKMGSRMKPTIFSDNVAKALKTWHHTAKKNVKHDTLSAPGSPFTSRPGTPLHGSTSLMHLLHRYQNDSLDSSFVEGKLI
ncbi:MLO-like protein 12, partial [Tanacetum coccineum]